MECCSPETDSFASRCPSRREFSAGVQEPLLEHSGEYLVNFVGKIGR